MAKVVKATREILDVNEELSKVAPKMEAKKTTKASEKKKSNSKKAKKVKSEKKHGKIRTFISEVKKEMSKVKWPTKKDMIKYSLATIVFIVFFAVFFYVINLIMAYLEAMV